MTAVAAALALVVAGAAALLALEWRRLSRWLERERADLEAQRQRDADRLAQEYESLSFREAAVGAEHERFRAWLDARAAELDARDRAAVEERRELLDRIQNPHGAIMRGVAEVTEGDPAGATDDEVDKAFIREHPESAAVAWDLDLAPLPFDETVGEPALQPVPDDAPEALIP